MTNPSKNKFSATRDEDVNFFFFITGGNIRRASHPSESSIIIELRSLTRIRLNFSKNFHRYFPREMNISTQQKIKIIIYFENNKEGRVD